MLLLNIRLIRLVLCWALAMVLGGLNLYAAPITTSPKENSSLYRWVEAPKQEALEVSQASQRLETAIANPEYMLKNWVELPTAPNIRNKKIQRLSLREAILLALRYNPNIQNAELDRIIQRYQLRLANNEFELQYALEGAASIENNRFSGVGHSVNKSLYVSPEVSLRTKYGTTLNVGIDNNVPNYNTFTPVLNFSFTQPLLRGFGKNINEARLLDARDAEFISKISLKQSIIDQITQVISAYRNLILSGNNLENQRRQLEEARRTFEINQKKIAAGQLEPTGNIQQSYQIESLSLMVEQAENDFKTAAQDLLQTIGLDPNMHLAVPSDVNLDHVKVPNLQQSIDIALDHNSQYLAQKMALKADERAYNLAKNDQLWELNLSGGIQSGTTSDVTGLNRGLRGIYNGRNINESISLSLHIPINDVSRRSQLINAKVKLERDRLNLIASKRALITTITNTINAIQSQAKQYRLAEKQVRLARQSYELEKKKLQAGIATALDVSNTQNQLIQAQAGLISAKIAYLNQLSALQRLLGTTLDEWQIKLRYGQ
ncbi:TolC family protein [Legionella sp. CNM-1927-20]|uniref:TolC family protein n=1 Tax=Legionella sp. CNM-1927-20 TaxID=3422221 RepID=UPI00403AC76C